MPTRPHRWLRHFKPKNIIGTLLGYANCECGNTLRGSHGSYMISSHGGRCICDDCYGEFKDEIKRNDHAVLSEPYDEYVGLSRQMCYQICTNPACEWHSKDGRFEWGKDSSLPNGYWKLKGRGGA